MLIYRFLVVMIRGFIQHSFNSYHFVLLRFFLGSGIKVQGTTVTSLVTEIATKRIKKKTKRMIRIMNVSRISKENTRSPQIGKRPRDKKDVFKKITHYTTHMISLDEKAESCCPHRDYGKAHSFHIKCFFRKINCIFSRS